MTDCSNSPTLQGFSSRAVHAGEIRRKPHHALIDPIVQTSTYTFDNMEAVCQFQEAHKQGHVADRFEYGRYGNPTVAAAEERLAALENAESAIQVTSGMAAITCTFLSILRSGRHIIMTDDSYRRTRQFCEEHLKRFNIACTVVPLGDYDALEAAIRPETRLIFSETPSNPFMRVLDVERFAEIGRRHGVLTVIDATLSTPINLRPLDWGTDLVIHSATKYLGGHNDLLAGFIAGSKRLIDPLREAIGIFGGISDPNTAYLLLRGMKTLHVRVAQQNRSAQRGLVSGINVFGWTTALAAYRDGQEWLTQVLSYLQTNRDIVTQFVKEELPGISVSPLEGTYLAWLDCRETGIAKPYDFFLQQARVALNDGATFGKGGEGFVRLNFGCSRATLREALERMKGALCA